ncbi:MAG: hypothetical protein KA124_01395 [Luteimonas sp.]|nr:hypothetical protein [Luteimonas sp.]
MFTVTPDFVTGYLKLAGTPDPDVLAARKHELVQKQQPMKLISLWFVIVGAILTITIIFAIVGVPLLCIAGWVHARARKNVRTIEAAYQDFVSAHPTLQVA